MLEGYAISSEEVTPWQVLIYVNTSCFTVRFLISRMLDAWVKHMYSTRNILMDSEIAKIELEETSFLDMRSQEWRSSRPW